MLILDHNYGSWRLAAFEFLAVAFFAITATVLLLASRARINNEKGENDGEDDVPHQTPLPLLPKARAGILETIRELAGDRTPFWMLDQVKETGSYSYRLAVPPGSAVIGNAELTRSILSDPHHDKAVDLLKSFEITLGGTCMFTQTNDVARVTRKNALRAFAPDQVRNRMNAVCRRHVGEWIDSVLEPAAESGTPIDPCREMLYVAFGVVCEVIFDYRATREECDQFLEHGQVTAVEFGFKQMMNPLRPILGKWLAERARAFQSVRWIQGFGLRMLAEHQRRKKQERRDGGEGEGYARNTVIAIIDDDPRYKSNEEKLPELLLWLFAGHDTVGFTMGTALYHLARHQSEMARLRSAILRRDSEDNDASAYSSYSSLKELQNVIRESNRLLPATANISIRKLGRDVTTPDGKHQIPSGTTVFLPQFLPNHDPNLYENPGSFLPSRWDNPTTEMLEANMPFSVGPRSCPGLALARAEMDQILPRLIRDYDFDVVREGEAKFFITLKPVGVLLRPRRRASVASRTMD